MAAEGLNEEGLSKNPNLELAQWKFLLSLNDDKITGREHLEEKLMAAIKKDDMAPFYEECCQDLKIHLDQNLLTDMKARNEAKLNELNSAIDDAEKNLGEMEVRDTNLRKAEFLSRIGDKEGALSALRKANDKTVSLGHRLDIVFHYIRIGLFYMDHDIITRNIEKAKSLIEEGGDWDRRNRLKVYQGVYCMAIRDFAKAAELFLDTVSTFTSYELMDYSEFVRYTVILSMIALPRNELKEKVIKGSEILEVLHELKDTKNYLFSLYDCQYADFFKELAKVEQSMKYDRLLTNHYRYYVREMRISAYVQLLESYQNLTLFSMADQFGVSVEFMDRELFHFIAAGRIHCRIDKVGGIVETNRPDSKNYQYQQMIKQGDHLLNRIQKLSRVINI